MEIYVRVLVLSNIAQRQEHTFNNATERVLYFHIKPITFLLHTCFNHKKLNNIYYITFCGVK